MSTRLMALSAAELAAVPAGGLHHALTCKAALWIESAGFLFEDWPQIGATDCALLQPAQGALVAAALDVLALMALTPEGREAVANFRSQPVFQQAEAE